MMTKIEVIEKDPTDNNYCGIVMQWHVTKEWINSGIVVRESTPEKAFAKALKEAIDWKIWV